METAEPAVDPTSVVCGPASPDDGCSLLCRRGVAFANSFEYDKPDDILYYILYVWKQVGMDQEKDQLHMYGGASLRNSITATLRNYIQYISPAEIPSDAYLLGAEVVQAPLDLIALSVCEL